MDDKLTKDTIENIIHSFAAKNVECNEQNDEEGENACIEVMNTLHSFLEEMEQNEKLREAINEFCL